jgi:hypothetical protein
MVIFLLIVIVFILLNIDHNLKVFNDNVEELLKKIINKG